MRLQTFAICQLGSYLAQHLRAGFAHVNDAGALLEIVDPKRRTEARRAAGGQYMIRASAVVAQAFAGVGAQKNRAFVLKQPLPLVWL